MSNGKPAELSAQAPSQGSASSTKKTSTQPEKARKAPRRATIVRPYPMFTLERALSIATVIKDKNAGNPWAPSQVAKGLGMGEKSSALDLLTRASLLYGLTSGTRAASYISIEKLGREIVYAPNPQAELVARRRAFLNVEIFSKVLEYYKGNGLPELDFLSNTLTAEFGLPRELHEEFRKIFLENCDFTEIGSNWLGIDTPPLAIERRSAPDAETPSVRAFASVENPDGKRCFVIMPFSERLSNRPKGFFDEVFDSLIKPAAEAAGFDVLTANKDGSDVIQSTIINELMDADLVVADLTDHNPNVLFELGVRMAQEKPVAIIKTEDTGGIFDVDNPLRVFEYSSNLWGSTIKYDLPRLEGHLRATWETRDSNRSYISILRSRA
jgi:hypothetical protein